MNGMHIAVTDRHLPTKESVFFGLKRRQQRGEGGSSSESGVLGFRMSQIKLCCGILDVANLAFWKVRSL